MLLKLLTLIKLLQRWSSVLVIPLYTGHFSLMSNTVIYGHVWKPVDNGVLLFRTGIPKIKYVTKNSLFKIHSKVTLNTFTVDNGNRLQ